MKIFAAIITIFLIFGLLGIPSGVFAQETSFTRSYTTLQHNTSTFLINSFIPLLKGGGGGRGSGGGRRSLRSQGYSGYTTTGGSSTSSNNENNGIVDIITIIMGLSILAPFIWWKLKK